MFRHQVTLIVAMTHEVGKQCCLYLQDLTYAYAVVKQTQNAVTIYKLLVSAKHPDEMTSVKA